jgi:hypothetical protein
VGDMGCVGIWIYLSRKIKFRTDYDLKIINMKCVKCTRETPGSVRFCPNCGAEQLVIQGSAKEGNKSGTNNAWQSFHDAVSWLLPNSNQLFVSRVIGVYLIWAMLNFVALLGFAEKPFKNSYNSEFYPFQTDYIGYYDYREFIIYLIFPPFVLLVLRLLKIDLKSLEG